MFNKTNRVETEGCNCVTEIGIFFRGEIVENLNWIMEKISSFNILAINFIISKMFQLSLRLKAKLFKLWNIQNTAFQNVNI